MPRLAHPFLPALAIQYLMMFILLIYFLCNFYIVSWLQILIWKTVQVLQATLMKQLEIEATLETLNGKSIGVSRLTQLSWIVS